jgi:hypothetical protein
MANGKELMSDEMLREAEEAAAKWQTLVASGQRRAAAKGLTEDDVPRLVSEARRDRHAR